MKLIDSRRIATLIATEKEMGDKSVYDDSEKKQQGHWWCNLLVVIYLVLRHSDSTEYRLRPIFFAYENRDQITRLFVKTFETSQPAFEKRKKLVLKRYGAKLNFYYQI